jgi:hypothetical protein
MRRRLEHGEKAVQLSDGNAAELGGKLRKANEMVSSETCI